MVLLGSLGVQMLIARAIFSTWTFSKLLSGGFFGTWRWPRGALWVSSESKVKRSNGPAMLESSEHFSGGLSRPLGMSGGGLSESPQLQQLCSIKCLGDPEIFDASNSHLMVTLGP